MLGALPTSDGVTFRVWAPYARSVEVELGDEYWPLTQHRDGVWTGQVATARPGSRYRFRLNGESSLPDPCSRSQPEGVDGPSEVIDPTAFTWHDQDWKGLPPEGLVIYQCHVGTATPEGTFDALIGQLERLRQLGITAIQLLPVAEFAGQRNWGYDGVDLYAPSHVYGGPVGLKSVIDAAHQHELGVILDVVYNHLGPEGNYLSQFSPDYFTDRYRTPWGAAINYTNAWVRRFFLENARYWLDEYHADGLRLDATHAIHDPSDPHILAELSQVARPAVLIAETSENNPRYIADWGFDAVYADDFHHALRRYLVGDHEGYFAQFAGTLEEVAQVVQQGWLHQLRGAPAINIAAHHLVYAIQNHDQVGNRAFGERLNHQIDLERYRVASMLLLFLPFTPLLFMGQEFAASTPFQFFTDFPPELGRLVTQGRRIEFAAFSAFADPATREQIPDPQAESTFLASKLRLEESSISPGADIQALYRSLLELRATDPVLRIQDRRSMSVQASSEHVLMVDRRRGIQHRRLIANFGDTPYPIQGVDDEYHVLLTSGVQQPSSVVVPARTGVILAW